MRLQEAIAQTGRVTSKKDGFVPSGALACTSAFDHIVMAKTKLYYCCKCDFGPHNVAIHPACIECNHELDGCCHIITTSSADRSASMYEGTSASGCPSKAGSISDVGSSQQDTTLHSNSNRSATPHHDDPHTTVIKETGSSNTKSIPARGFDGTLWSCCNCGSGPSPPDTQPQPACFNCEHLCCDKCQFHYGLQPLVEDLKYLDPEHVQICWSGHSSWLNKFKCYVEGWSGETWDWWPLQPARQRLKTNEARVSWTCVSRSRSLECRVG
jgi:hypothetical protein